MAGKPPAEVPAEPAAIKILLCGIRPAAHQITPKTWANLLSRFRQELRLSGVIDPGFMGRAARHPAWRPLMQAIDADKGMSNGLASFCNWCASNDISPSLVDDALIRKFHDWLETRTLCLKPRDVVRRTPQFWNKAGEQNEAWPKSRLTPVSFKAAAKRLQWDNLPRTLLADAEVYVAMRAKPDPFDERLNAPIRPLSASTIQQQKTHIRLAASVLIENGMPVEEAASLAALVEPERFKIILRHYHERGNGRPNAFAICLSKTLLQVAYHYVDVSAEHLSRLKRIGAKLPSIPFELTAKNKALLRKFESDRLKANLLFLPDQLAAVVTKGLSEGRVDFVKAQMAVAIEFQLAIPLRPQNLSRLNWRRHFIEPDGPKGPLLLHIPKEETKSRKVDFTAELPDRLALRIRWYRRHILPCLKADADGDLFVTRRGEPKSQETLTDQLNKTLASFLGVDMSPHQFRHLGGSSYLDENPEDTETVKALLGHAWTKTTRIYVGSASRRASKAYNRFVFDRREALKLKGKPRRTPSRKKERAPCAS